MFLRIAAALIAACCVLTAEAAPTAEDFVRAATTNVAISPSGKYVAIITASADYESALAVAPFENGKLGKFVGVRLGKHLIRGVFFKTDDRLIVSLLQMDVPVRGAKDIDGDQWKINRSMTVAVNRDGSDSQVMMIENETGTSVQSALWDDPTHILISANNKGSYAENLFKADIMTGEVETAEDGRARLEGTTRNQYAVITTGWETSVDGFAYVRYDYSDKTKTILVYTRPRGGDWNRFASYPVIDGAPTLQFAGMASDRTAYVLERAGEDKRAAWEYDLVTGKPIRKVIGDNVGEVVDMHSSRFKGQLVGATVVTAGMPQTRYTSKSLAAAQAALDESYPEYPIRSILSYSRDMGVYSVRLEGPDQPPVFIVFDARNMAVTPEIASTGLSKADMGTTRTVTWPSSDGRMITGYLTMPPGVSKPPLVVMPHGGPESSDDLYFDVWRQFIATRGYAVFQPQFRGGDGFGLAHERAGHGTWGTLVQDDVRTGVEKLIADGLVDPQRRCIFGWSYGGYMAMAGAALSPDLYKCSIAGAGVADVDAMLAWEGEGGGSEGEGFKYWIARMGDHDARVAASPAKFAANVKIPLLLIHGTKDGVVPIEQSELMETAMKKAGKPVTFVKIEGMGHPPVGPASLQVLQELEKFFAKNL